MKKLVFVFSMVLFGAMGLMAQEATTAKKACSKEKAAGCCSKKAVEGTASVDTKVLSAAESLAEQDENITKRVCAESGATSFYKKEVCEKSGKISYSQVSYDADSKQFVNVSPNDIGNADGGKVMQMKNSTEAVAHPKAKAACSSSKEKAACCSGKKGKAEKTQK